MVEEFWIKKADIYSKEGFEINEMGTHPYLIDFFHKHCADAKTILDYGCGDGSLISKLSQELEISLFDVSPSMLNIARDKLAHLNPQIYTDANNLPESYYDCIFISMVFICVPTEDEIEYIIDKAVFAKKKNGTVLVANPHPCFRNEPFSSYYTEYTVGKPFNYFNNGERHQIFLRNKPITFFDYNWSIAFLLNSFLKKGLNLVELLEVRDNQTNSFFNQKFSPSIIYAFK